MGPSELGSPDGAPCGGGHGWGGQEDGGEAERSPVQPTSFKWSLHLCCDLRVTVTERIRESSLIDVTAGFSERGLSC